MESVVFSVSVESRKQFISYGIKYFLGNFNLVFGYT